MRYLITGGSGYIGTRLVQRLAEREETERVVIADIRPPTAFRPKVTYERLDVRDAAAARELLATEQPDALVHLAFVLNPIPDERVQYVHEDDVGEALIRLLDGRCDGPFNLAGDGMMTWGECADLIGLRRRRVPRKAFWKFGELMWRLRLAETPPGNLHFIIH